MESCYDKRMLMKNITTEELVEIVRNIVKDELKEFVKEDIRARIKRLMEALKDEEEKG